MKEDIGLRLRKRNLFPIVLVIMFFVLVFPTLLRFYHGNDSLIGSESYYHFRAARELIRSGSLNLANPPESIPDASYSPRDYIFNPYHYLLVYASKAISLLTASRIVPLLLGFLSVLVFNLILKGFFEESYKRHVILLLLVLNPAFIYTFTVSNQHSAAIFFTLLGFLFFMRKGAAGTLLSLLCFSVVSLFSLFNAVLVILLLLAYTLTKRDRQSRFIVSVIFIALFSFASRVSLFYNYTYTPKVNIFSNLFSDLGGIIGFGIFTIVLAVYGIFKGWKEKSGFIYFMILGLLAVASLLFIGNVANMYIMFLISIPAAIGFLKLYDSDWTFGDVKKLALLILVCGIMFSTTSYLTRLSAMPPSKDVFESLNWMADNAFKDGFVLSHYDNGYLISTIARNPVFVDSLSAYDYDQRFLYKVQDTMFYSRDLEETKQLFSVYRISYIYVTPDMKSGLVWSRDNEGLRFLFTSQKTFNRIYEKNGIEIWQVIDASPAKTV
jgi:hypothetical protein